MSYYDPSQQQPPNQQPSGPSWPTQQSGQLPPQYTQYPQQPPYQQTGPGIPPPPQYYPTGGLPPQYYPTGGLPPQYPQQPPRKSGSIPPWMIFLSIAILAFIAASILYGKNTTTTTTTLTGAQIAATNSAQLVATNSVSGTVDTGSTPDTNTSAAHFTVGSTASTPDGFIVTILKVYTSAGDTYDTPKSGSQYLVVDASVKNATGQIQHMSSGQFTLTDNTGQHIDDTIALLQEVHYFTGGTLQNGAIMRGQLVYEVPKGKANYELTFMGNMFGNYQTIWDVHS